MTHRIIPAIMSGGAGTRLWPLSTEAKPKQFHRLGGSGTMFAETVSRVRGEVGALSFAPPIVLGNAAHARLVESELAANGVAPAAVVLEPMPRNTAAVAVIAAALAEEMGTDALALLLPADHLITNAEAFRTAIERAAPIARDRIVTFGISPDRPATGYGYIRRGDALADGVFTIDAFREKPDEATAQRYLEEGGHSWNAGIFLFNPRVMMEEFAYAGDIRDAALAALESAERRGVEIHLKPEAFARVRAEPLDTAVMEKTKRAAVVPCDIGWADVGSWDEMWRLAQRDENGNVSHGQSVVIDGANNLLRSEGVPIYAAGVHDLIVVATPEAVIILPRQRAQDVKTLRETALKTREN